MATIEKIKNDSRKNKAKISELQKKQHTLEASLTEQENLEVVRMVKAVKLTNKELTAVLKGYASGRITLPQDIQAKIGEEDEDEKEMEDENEA